MTLVVVVRGTDPGIALRLVPWALLTGGSAMGLPGAAIACYWVENLALDVTRSWGYILPMDLLLSESTGLLC